MEALISSGSTLEAQDKVKIHCIHTASLVPRPEREGGKKGLVSTVCALHLIAVEFDPPAPLTFDSCMYTCDVNADTKRYVVYTVIIASEYDLWRAFQKLSIVLCYALRWQGTPGLS